MDKIKPEAEYVFEASWEVCNKVGGIYTVVKSKAALMTEAYSNYFMVGPLNNRNAKIEAVQKVPPKWLDEVFSELQKENINCFYGQWRCKGEPYVILIDFYKLTSMRTGLRKWLWESYGIETHTSGWDYDEPMLWSYAVGRLLEEIYVKLGSMKMVGHFHEWMSGIALLHLKSRDIPVKTVFTTHATLLGRSIAGNGENLYNMLDNICPHDEAKKRKVLDKFTTETACAKNADVFTTVSEITSIEAEKILDKKADVLLLNGLDIERFPTFEESSINHRIFRDKAREFCSLFFNPFYPLDLEQSLFFFIVGRYEYKNKGIDHFIEALGRLNQKMKDENSKKNVIVFFWIPSGVNGIKTALLENREQFEQVSEFVQSELPSIRSKLLSRIMNDENLNNISLFDKEQLDDIETFKVKFVKDDGPFISTHEFFDEANDPILNNLRRVGLDNKEDDKVKVIFYPVYLDGFDRLLELKYYQAIQACHLGVFPSYYEPWGYTPLESAALGVPAITTDLAGFGRFIKEHRQDDKGIFVINRLERQDEDAIAQLAEMMLDYTKLNRNDRVEQKISAKKLAELADWKMLVNNYFKAHNLALSR